MISILFTFQYGDIQMNTKTPTSQSYTTYTFQYGDIQISDNLSN